MRVPEGLIKGPLDVRCRKLKLPALVIACLLLLSALFYLQQDEAQRTLKVNPDKAESWFTLATRPHSRTHHELFELEGPFDTGPLREVCAAVKWRTGVYFDCSINSGGVGNIRAFILTCVRYAIEAGAHLVMPTIRKRDPNDLANLFTDHKPLEYMFDASHFVTSLATACPEMRIIASVDAIPHGDVKKVHEIKPNSIANFGKHDETGIKGVNRYAGTFRVDFDYFLRQHNQPLFESPVVIRLTWATFFEWPIALDGARFANSFGRILRFRSDIRILASKVLDEMLKRYDITGDQLLNYMGVHLRADSDVLDWWPKEVDQINDAIGQARQHKFKYIYLATGSNSSYTTFASRASKELDATTFSKETLLQGSDLDEMNALQWDQRGLIDYLVLLRSAWFSGMSASSFSMNIASRRRLLKSGIDTTAWRGQEDGYSHLYGPRHSYLHHWVYFIEEALWP